MADDISSNIQKCSDVIYSALHSHPDFLTQVLSPLFEKIKEDIQETRFLEATLGLLKLYAKFIIPKKTGINIETFANMYIGTEITRKVYQKNAGSYIKTRFSNLVWDKTKQPFIDLCNLVCLFVVAQITLNIAIHAQSVGAKNRIPPLENFFSFKNINTFSLNAFILNSLYEEFNNLPSMQAFGHRRKLSSFFPFPSKSQSIISRTAKEIGILKEAQHLKDLSSALEAIKVLRLKSWKRLNLDKIPLETSTKALTVREGYEESDKADKKKEKSSDDAADGLENISPEDWLEYIITNYHQEIASELAVFWPKPHSQMTQKSQQQETLQLNCA